MARNSADWPITTPAQRARLTPRHEPYWRGIHPGLHLGYRKGKWIARRSEAGHTTKKSIGYADDHDKANGQTILSYKQATEKALTQMSAPTPGGYTVAKAWEAYLADYEVRSGKDTKGLEYAYNRHIKKKLGHIRLDSLQTGSIRRWLNDLARTDEPEKRRAKQATANKQLTKLKAALNYAYQHEMGGNRAVWDKVRPFKNVDAPRIRFITLKQVNALIKYAEPAFVPLIQAAVLTGARWSELCRLQVSDVYRDRIYIAESKSGKARDIPLSAEGASFFKKACKSAVDHVFTVDGGPWGKSMQHRRMQVASKSAKISPAINFHLLRHFYASLLVGEGVSLQIVAQLLGHSDTRVTEKHYAHLQPLTLANAVQENLHIGFT
jgi:integrase